MITLSPPSPVPAALSVQGLTKVYANGKRALDGVTLSVPRGQVFGLLGPNGAGKSTLINILAGLTNKSSGTATVWGFDLDRDPRNARGSIGVVPQELLFDPFFTPREALELQAGLYGIPKAQRRTAEILAALSLSDKADTYARQLSGGMKRRVLIAKALVHQPPILVLDEPTAGVDIELRQHLWAYVRKLNQAGTTVILTTHYLEEAQSLCDRIAIINHGQVIADATTADLLALAHDKQLRFTVENPPADSAALDAALADLTLRHLPSGELEVTYDKRLTHAGAVLARISATGLVVVDVSTREADLEDVFLHLTTAKVAA